MIDIKGLINKLNEARNAYYNTGNSIMSDKEYDNLYDELVKIEKETGIIMSNSPTQSVGYTVLTGFNKSRHKYPAKSLDKTKDKDMIVKFLGDKSGLISFKLDGLTTVLTYQGGKLLKAVTRGDGEVGYDITENAYHFKNIPLTIPYAGTLVLRGESAMSYSTFNKVSTNGKHENPRNLVSGTVRNLNSSIVSDRGIEWICFEVVEGLSGNSKNEKFDKLKYLGFDVVKSITCKCKESIVNAINTLESNIDKYEYPTDGLVATFDDIDYSNSLGETLHHPLHSYALKWKDETYKTTLRDIDWQVGRTGVVTPVAIFDEVDLDGATTTRASLHNLDIFQKLELGIGDTITVYRANMVIPQVHENLTRSNTYEHPTTCPMCGKELNIKSNLTTRFLVCDNKDCKARIIGKLVHFVSRDAMNIDGLSEETIKKLVDRGWIKDLCDIYTLQSFQQDIVCMSGFGVTSYRNMIKSIEKSKTCKLDSFIYSLGIDGVGKSTSKLLANKFKTYENLSTCTIDDLKTIGGIGNVVAKSIYNYFNSNNSLTATILSEILDIEEVKEVNGNILNGLTFVITGSLSHFSNRKELQLKIESLGGKVSGSVSTKTSYLINNDRASQAGKNKKAIELGIQIISEDDFLNLINKY